ncbi:MAG: helix-hairpin-helix domain-containing protein [Candidatus Acidiferrum sp.]
MPLPRMFAVLPFFLASALIIVAGSAGCNSNDPDQRARDEKTRDEVAKATERAKPELEEAGRKLGEAAHDAADEARAVAQGVRDGLNDGQHPLVDLNSASETELMNLPGVARPAAHRIIAGRPYRDKHDLLDKNILSGAEYQRIRDQVTAK